MRLANAEASPTVRKGSRRSKCFLSESAPRGQGTRVNPTYKTEWKQTDMRSAIFIIAVFVLMQLIGCAVTDHYKTRADAEADELFERGWLPAIIPASARDITTSNDLDINTSKGEFHYDISDTSDFVGHLRPYSGRKPTTVRWQNFASEQQSKGRNVLEFTDQRSVWLFSIDTKKGHVRYIMW
jgi:hypothetical protein